MRYGATMIAVAVLFATVLAAEVGASGGSETGGSDDDSQGPTIAPVSKRPWYADAKCPALKIYNPGLTRSIVFPAPAPATPPFY